MNFFLLKDNITFLKFNFPQVVFFRKLRKARNGDIFATKSPTGKNICTAVGKKIASFLNLPNPDCYTGHCWRGTAATILADEGLSVQQIKRKNIKFFLNLKAFINCNFNSGVTGHKSDTAVQVYVDNSSSSKSTAAASIAISGISSSTFISETNMDNLTLMKRPRFANQGQQQSSTYNINITVGANANCAGLSMFGSP